MIKPRRHNTKWTIQDYSALNDMWNSGYSTTRIAKELERTIYGVGSKLVELGLAKMSGHSMQIRFPQNWKNPNKFKAVIKMEKTVFEKIKDIQAQHIKLVSAISYDEIFTEIKRLEGQIAEYNSIENKPVFVDKKIEELNVEIERLVEFSNTSIWA